jgi:hypothetical protein
MAAKDSPKSSSAEVSSVTEAINETPPLQWSAIESTDLKQYIANLRAAGCPEQIIRDIIVSDVNQDFLKRAREIWPLRVTEYWQKNQQSIPGPKQMDQLMALDKEHQELFKELLGTRISRQELIDTLYLQVHGDEQQLSFLPEERREAAMKALADTDLESQEAKLRSNGSFYGGREEQKLFNERLKTLADVLTPEELEEFHIRNSPAGSILKSETRYLNLTPEEYKQLLLARESSPEREQTKETVRKLFGDERAKEFEQVSSAFYINARTGAEAEGIPLDRVALAAKLANDSVTTGFAAINDRSLSVEERKARAREIQAQTETQIKNLLGDKASQTMLRDFRNLFRSGINTIR